MRIAFHAPLKPPDHPVPSGDRRMARLLMEAIERGGHAVVSAGRFRSYDGTGDDRRQARIEALGARWAERLVRRWRDRPPDLWFTYHCYHKAPDWLGPALSSAFAIPYVIAEASFAPKQEGGPWDRGHRAAADAMARADAVITLNPADAECVRPLARRLVPMNPFLDADGYAPGPRDRVPRLLTVAMMREGDKLVSYRVLGAALATLLDRPWTLSVVGDGPAREAVRDALAPVGERTEWLGEVDPEAMPAVYGRHDLYVWPAVSEAYGMAFLEAQAAGMAVVAGRAGGVPSIVAEGESGLLTAEGDATAFAAAVAHLLDAPEQRAAFGAAARMRVKRDHAMDGGPHRPSTAFSGN